MAQSRERTLLQSCLETTTAKVIGIARVKSICSAVLSLLLLTLLMNISCVACARDHRKQTNLEARVGSHVVFNCYIDFPYDSPIPYVVHWSKDVSQVRVRQGESLRVNPLRGKWMHVAHTSCWPALIAFTHKYTACVFITSLRRYPSAGYCALVMPHAELSIYP